MELLTRKAGLWISVIGITLFLFNFVTYTLWEIDIDILGAMLFILGLVIATACGKSIKQSHELFTRRNGVRLCILAVVMSSIFGYSTIPVLSGDFAGFFGLGVFAIGLILITVRWNH